MAQPGLLSGEQLADAWPILAPEERAEGFGLLSQREAEDFFDGRSARDQADLLLALEPEERKRWLRFLAPDDAADLIQAADPDGRPSLVELLDDTTRIEVTALLAYAEDEAGGLMNPRFARVRPNMSIEEAIRYLRLQAVQQDEPLHYAYALDTDQKLLGVLSFRELFKAAPVNTVRDVMRTSLITVQEDTDQEEVARKIREHGLLAIPVVDAEQRMKGIVTADDIVAVVAEEATEDIQKIGGSEALDEPYLRIELRRLVRKRAGWLAALFLGEMLTASAMGYYEAEIARAVVLALFVPLIISSGGNSGSQATTLVIRAMALGEVRLRDWWRVCRREVLVGLGLGAILSTIGLFRILLWHWIGGAYGQHYGLVAITVALSLVGVVLWGTLAGAMLPFALRRLGLDPASASAPFVATLVDVTGLVIYFTVASLVLRGTLL